MHADFLTYFSLQSMTVKYSRNHQLDILLPNISQCTHWSPMFRSLTPNAPRRSQWAKAAHQFN